jgi:hypothetical protein
MITFTFVWSVTFFVASIIKLTACTTFHEWSSSSIRIRNTFNIFARISRIWIYAISRHFASCLHILGWTNEIARSWSRGSCFRWFITTITISRMVASICFRIKFLSIRTLHFPSCVILTSYERATI